MITQPAVLLQTVVVRKWFVLKKGWFGRNRVVAKAVDGVSVGVRRGERLAIVGESGSGKTSLARLMLNLYQPTSGEVYFEGIALSKIKVATNRRFHNAVQAVFQDPANSLNPRMRVEAIIREPIEINGQLGKIAIREKVLESLTEVGLAPEAAQRYPHEFSGGQKQRIAIARALSSDPALVVLDEAVSSLDLSTKAQILNLLLHLHEIRGLSYVFISHDLSSVRYLCERVAVMYLGEVVETGPIAELFERPLHPYTQALLAAILSGKPRTQRVRSVNLQEAPSIISAPSGCRFRTRCPFAFARCAEEAPSLRDAGIEHSVACHLYDTVPAIPYIRSPRSQAKSAGPH